MSGPDLRETGPRKTGPRETASRGRTVRGVSMRAAAMACAALCALWLAAVAAYAFGYFSGPTHGADAGAALMLLVAATTPVGALAAVLAALRSVATGDRAIPENAASGRGGQTTGLSPEGARIATEAAQAASAETVRALSARIAALEAILAETRNGVAALTELAGVEAARPPARKPAPARRPATSHTAPPAPPPENEPALPFAETSLPSGSVAWADILRALEFPRSADDAEGFRAMRAALADAQIAQLLQAAEDVLNILATSGLHMEDLNPEPADLEAWASYARGTRGAAAGGVGAVHDAAALDAARILLRADAVFRDAALVFARRWSGLVTRIHTELGGGDVMAQAANTRSGRAFMLLTRALGAFD